LKTASCITIDWIRYEAIKNIAKAQACCGDIQGALEITNLITDYKNVALRSIEKIKQEKEVK
jgi:hypothetical protein